MSGRNCLRHPLRTRLPLRTARDATTPSSFRTCRPASATLFHLTFVHSSASHSPAPRSLAAGREKPEKRGPPQPKQLPQRQLLPRRRHIPLQAPSGDGERQRRLRRISALRPSRARLAQINHLRRRRLPQSQTLTFHLLRQVQALMRMGLPKLEAVQFWRSLDYERRCRYGGHWQRSQITKYLSWDCARNRQATLMLQQTAS
mmetsp:Transcript_53674/g.127884  ORF Transcript_53674/g.127884 Transcript_53674/m.127884 type:complete len:202 (+) Transcript_53674:1031-1636(+)